MAWFEFIWTAKAVEKLLQHGLTQDAFVWAFQNYESELVSRSSGRPLRIGPTPDGRRIVMVFEWIETEITVFPITAFERTES